METLFDDVQRKISYELGIKYLPIPQQYSKNLKLESDIEQHL